MPLDIHDQRWLVEQFNEVREMISLAKESNQKAIAEAVGPIAESIHGNGTEGLKAASVRHDAYFKIMGSCLVLVGGGVIKALLG